MKPKINIQQIISNLTAAGYAPDPLDTHRRIIECRKCAGCKKANLVYYGFSNHENYLCFSGCPECGKANFFRILSDIYSPVEEIISGENLERSAA